jgi:hypothetical protein
MGFWDKKQDAQIDEKKADESVQSKTEIDQLVEKLGASFEERLRPIREEVTGIKAKFDAIEQAASATEDAEPADLATNAEKWKQENLGPLAVQNALLAARITEREVLDSVPDEWRDVVIPRVRELLDKQTNIQQKASPSYPAYVQNCVDLIIGQEAKKAGLRRDSKTKQFFIEDATRSSSEATPLNDASLDWIDRKGRVHKGSETLQKLGIDPVEFAKSGEVM